jgi:hypothetical protein
MRRSWELPAAWHTLKLIALRDIVYNCWECPGLPGMPCDMSRHRLAKTKHHLHKFYKLSMHACSPAGNTRFHKICARPFVTNSCMSMYSIYNSQVAWASSSVLSFKVCCSRDAQFMERSLLLALVWCVSVRILAFIFQVQHCLESDVNSRCSLCSQTSIVGIAT